MSENENSFPSIVFKVKDEYYSINSQYIATIMQLPPYEQLPDAAPCVTGFFMHRGTAVQMLNLRLLFGQRTLEQEYDDFCAMIDIRKQDHIRWVEELDRSIQENRPFELATDPHQCAFGKWYDAFSSENSAVLFHMRKIEEPHRKLHEAAIEVGRCSQACEQCQRDECLKSIMTKIQKESMPTILRLLEDSKDIFHSNIYREMVLLLKDQDGMGLVVDEVLSVEDLEDLGDSQNLLQSSPHIRAVKRSEKITNPILELDLYKILGLPNAEAPAAI